MEQCYYVFDALLRLISESRGFRRCFGLVASSLLSLLANGGPFGDTYLFEQVLEDVHGGGFCSVRILAIQVMFKFQWGCEVGALKLEASRPV